LKMKNKIYNKLIAILIAACMASSSMVSVGAIKPVKLGFFSKDEVQKMATINRKITDVIFNLDILLGKVGDKEVNSAIGLAKKSLEKLQSKEVCNFSSVNKVEKEVDKVQEEVKSVETLLKTIENEQIGSEETKGLVQAIKARFDGINEHIENILQNIDNNERLENEKNIKKIGEKKDKLQELVGFLQKLDSNFKPSDKINEAIKKTENINKATEEQLKDIAALLDDAIKDLETNDKFLSEKLKDNFEEVKQMFTMADKIVEYSGIIKFRSEIEQIRIKFNRIYKDSDKGSQNDSMMPEKIEQTEAILANLKECMDEFNKYLSDNIGIKEEEVSRLSQYTLKNGTSNKHVTKGNECIDLVQRAIGAYYKKLSNKTKLSEDDVKEISDEYNKAIKALKDFDEGKRINVPEWQKKEKKESYILLSDAEKRMRESKNNIGIDKETKKEYEKLLCGKESADDGWLCAICNLYNIKNKNDIIKSSGWFGNFNTSKNDLKKILADKFNILEEDIPKTGSFDNTLEVLSKMKINNVSVKLKLDGSSDRSCASNLSVVKTLLLRHFSQSQNPVLVNVNKDYANQNLAIVVVGVNISTGIALVANSQDNSIKMAKINDLAGMICQDDSAMTFATRNVQMIFPIDNKNSIKYDNSVNSWEEFKNGLLPAISQ